MTRVPDSKYTLGNWAAKSRHYIADNGDVEPINKQDNGACLNQIDFSNFSLGKLGGRGGGGCTNEK